MRVYVAGPLTSSGSLMANLRRAVDAAERLRKGGLVPFVPHLYVHWETLYPHVNYEDWMALDFAWLDACDVLVRLDGDSKGADREVERARERGMPVFCEHEIWSLISKHATGGMVPARPGALAQVQREMPAWQQHNFPDRPGHWPLLGMVEELGELAHAVLKRAQGIRGTEEEHNAAIEDAIVDVLVYAVDLACAEGIDLDEAMTRVWAKVRARDWRKYPRHGVPPDAAIAKLAAKRDALGAEIEALTAQQPRLSMQLTESEE